MIVGFLVREHDKEDDRMNYYRDKHDEIVLFKTYEQARKVLSETLNNEGFIESIDLTQKYVLTNAMNANVRIK